MQDLKRFFLKYWPILILTISSLTIVWPTLLPGYFSHHDDLQIMRIFEMRKCFADLQIPCRWVSDMGFGNGYPLFNYYSGFPYYLGGILSFIFGFIGAAKILFFLPLFFGGIFMYLLSKELFQDEKVGVISAILFQFAPYRALDSYVRGDIAESFAIAFVPLIFYFFLLLVKENSKKNFLAATFSLGLFLTTHNIMTLFFIPLLLVWITFWILETKIKIFLPIFLSFILSFGLASFFIIPAFFEKSLVQVETLTRGDLNFRAHFATLNQLFFDRSWGYGASVPGPFDTISFQIGWPHWWLLILVVILMAFSRTFIKFRKLLLLFFGIFIFSIFMTHIRSAFIWENLPILAFVQFPWRFLSVSIFTASLLGGSILIFKSKIQNVLLLVIIAITIFLNWNYFQPQTFYPQLTDQEKLSGIFWDEQRKSSILDYLPKTAVEPREGAPSSPFFTSGKGEINNFINRSNSFEFDSKIIETSIVEVPVFDFPNWQVYVNDKKILNSHNNYLGRVSFQLEPGSYKILGRFEDTPIRTISNLISLLTIGVIIFLMSFKPRIKIFNYILW